MITEDSKIYNVLLVEDNPADAERMEYLLEEDSSVAYNIKTVIRIREAIVELKENDYDLILLDISLPDCVGAETVKTIKKAANDIPIIVTTGMNEEKLAQDCIAAGAQDYVLKEQSNPKTTIRTIGYSLLREQHSSVQELEKIISQYRALSSIGSSTSITAALSGTGCS